MTNRKESRCPDRESAGVQCELLEGHAGEHACPEALAEFMKRRYGKENPTHFHVTFMRFRPFEIREHISDEEAD